jgi:inosine-uridine nucleoside N-ribohydrolase
MSCTNTLTGINAFYAAEFNAALDPEAAYCVFEKFNNILMVPFDIFYSFVAEEVESLFNNKNTVKSNYIHHIFSYQIEQNRSSILGDPLTILCLFKP